VAVEIDFPGIVWEDAAAIAVASERFSQICFGLPFPSTRATASSRCCGTFFRASYVPCRFLFRPIPKGIYYTTGLYHQRQDEDVEVAGYSGMTRTSLIPGAP
jgi:hypothetical protein